MTVQQVRIQARIGRIFCGVLYVSLFLAGGYCIMAAGVRGFGFSVLGLGLIAGALWFLWQGTAPD